MSTLCLPDTAVPAAAGRPNWRLWTIHLYHEEHEGHEDQTEVFFFVVFVFFVVDLKPQNPGLQNVKNVKNGFWPFSVGTDCQPSHSNQNRVPIFFGFFEKFSGVRGIRKAEG
jgi:hypothetical protein